VDSELYCAAVVDGAGRWKQTIHVTLPAIAPTITIMFIMAMGNLLSVSFEKTLLFQNALTYEVSDVISTYVYRKGLSGSQYSYASAIDMFGTVVNLLFLLATNWICGRLGETSLW
jgi:putative aldouronate transport system permease protein